MIGPFLSLSLLFGWFDPPAPRPAPYVCGVAVPTSTPGIYSWRSCPDRPIPAPPSYRGRRW